MDQLFVDLLGKPSLNPPAIITIVAENFSLLADQARFLKATLAIPTVKQLPIDTSKRLIQIGFLPKELSEQAETSNWRIDHYIDNLDENVCDKMTQDLLAVQNRSILFFNDFSKLELLDYSKSHRKKLLVLVEKLKRFRGHFSVIFYQNSLPRNPSKLLRDLEYISDAVVKVKSCKAGYFKSIWSQPVPQTGTRTLIPTKVETQYYTCKIGKFYYSSDLLCFYERKQVTKNHLTRSDNNYSENEENSNPEAEDDDEDDDKELTNMMRNTAVDSDDDETTTMPYTAAQDPEKSRIFYYPDKNDDIDEDDPDNDLGI